MPPLFGSMALAVGALQVLSHIGGGKILFGNAKVFGIAIEGYTVWTTFMAAGTVSGLLMNTLAGLVAWGLLELGAAMFGGTRIIWNWKNVSFANRSFGFSTREVLPTLNTILFAKWVKRTFSSISSSISEFLSVFRTA